MTQSQFLRLTAGFMLAAGSAHADWQFAKWGMSEGDLIAASSGAAQASDPYVFPNGNAIMATGSFSSSAGSFETDFLFDPHGALVQVNLSQRDPISCSNTLRLLTEKYGAPANPDRTTAIWQDPKGGNVIGWRDTSAINKATGTSAEPDCVVTYKPLAQASDGL